jgi:hypothetical protein
MPRGSLSLENRLVPRLEGLNCSLRSFCSLFDLKISTISGIVSGGVRDFTSEETERIEDALAEMGELQLAVNDLNKMLVPIDWSRPEVGFALVVRRTSQISREFGSHVLIAARNEREQNYN